MTVTKYGSNAASNVEADESGLNDSLNTSLHNPIFGAKSSLVYRNRKFVGIVLALVSGILFTANNFLVNRYSVSACHLVLVRTLLQMLVYTIYCLVRSEPLLPGPPKQKMFILLQGFAAGLMLCCATTSFTLMPVPDALCIIFACPVVTIFLSALVLRDTINLPKVAAGLALFIGVVCVSKPPFIFQTVFQRVSEHPGSIPEAVEALIAYLSKQSQDLPQDYDNYYLGVVMAVTACVAQGVTCVMVAKVRSVVTPVLANWASIMGLVMGVLYWLIEDRNTGLALEDETPLNWALITGLSVCGLVAFTTLTLSLQLVSPNMVSSLRCLEMVGAFLVQSIITGLAPNILSSIGGGLIILGIVILGAEEKIEAGIKEVVTRIKAVFTSQSEDQTQEREKLLTKNIRIDIERR